MEAREQLHWLIDELFDEDPTRALRAYRWLEVKEIPWLERFVVARARRADWSWARVARLLGRTRQAVRQRFDVALAPLDQTLRSDPFAESIAAKAAWERVTSTSQREREIDENPIAW
jgi:hypothetical protein